MCSSLKLEKVPGLEDWSADFFSFFLKMPFSPPFGVQGLEFKMGISASGFNLAEAVGCKIYGG